MTERFDAIIIGAGHNGLVCACLLAKAGKKVLVLEAAGQSGGAAVTRPFSEAFSVPACAHLLYQLQPEVVRETGIDVALAADGLDSIVLDRNGRHLHYGGGAVENTSAGDSAAYAEFHRSMNRFAGFLATYLNKPPPRLGSAHPRDWLALGRLGLDLRRLGRGPMREFLRLIGMNIYDEVSERFENPLLRAGICVDAVLGTHLGPRSPNTVLTYLYRLAGNGGRLALPAGGMGAVSEALTAAARSQGAEIRTDTPVRRVVIDNGRVAGIETETGDVVNSRVVVSNADPKTTILRLVGARHVETGFTRRIHNLRMRGNAAKLHLALDGLPEIPGLDKRHYAQRLLIAPDPDYVERAFNPAKYGEWSPQPVIEMLFPSFRDASLAPAGQHVMSAVVQYAPYALGKGWSEAEKTRFRAAVIDAIAAYVPDLRERTLASELLTPADIEAEFRIAGGHWHHGELALDQFLFVRPVAGAAQYRMPLEGLWLCGAGAHPGGGISGAAGRNAAHAILSAGKEA